MWNAKQHSYEELREVVIDLLLGVEKADHDLNQFESLVTSVTTTLARRAGVNPNSSEYHQAQLHPYDAELVREIFWDLFRQGAITLGLNRMNPAYPFFKLSRFGEAMLKGQSPYRFHDTTSYIALIKGEIPDLSAEAQTYLEEAVTAFYAGCMLASCVMLGVAAEAEFLRLADAAVQGPYASDFAKVNKQHFIRKKIDAFHVALTPLISKLPHSATEDVDTNLTMIQSVLRIARNEAGHPTGASPQREQVYVFLQLFAPFGRQLASLRAALA